MKSWYAQRVNPGVRYRLSRSISAVKLEEHPGSTLRNPTDTLIEIPPDVEIELEGPVAASGLINVLWRGAAFSVFYEDLAERAEAIGLN